MKPIHPNTLAHLSQAIHRRTFLARTGAGVGAAALGSLLTEQGAAHGTEQGSKGTPGVLQALHHPPRAQRVIWMTMAGGPSHLETFDHKPELAKQHGQPMPESFTKGQQIAQLQGQKLVCFGPQTKFKKFESGTEICEWFEQIGAVSNEICFVR